MKLQNCLNNTVRLTNDSNGNPRYYLSVVDLENFVGIDYNWIIDNLKILKLTAYKGNQYGSGIVIKSYNLEMALRGIYILINRLHIVAKNLEKLGGSAYRLFSGRIEIKKNGKWIGYSDQANNLFNQIDDLK